MALDRHKTIRQALQYVEDNPEWPDIPRLDMEIWEIVARNLFEHANNTDTRISGGMNRAIRAQRIILDRLSGTRKTGTHPAVRTEKKVTFLDLTQSSIPTKETTDDD